MAETAQTETAGKKAKTPTKAQPANKGRGAGLRAKAKLEAVLANEIAKEKQEEAQRKAIGRPTVYSDELARVICKRISDGEHISTLIEDGLISSNGTFYRWQEANPAFREAVERAQEARAELWADELIEIADNPLLDPNDRRIRVETRWKVIGSLLYRRYGVKQQVDINQRIDVGSTAAEVLMRLTTQAREAKQLAAPQIIDVTPEKG